MLKSKGLLWAFMSATLVALGVNPLLVKPAQADSWCWCTDYVAKKFSLPRGYRDAHTWNDGYLQKNGFRQVPPQIGSIVVMERSYSPNKWNGGHVGMVERMTTVNERTTLHVRGANQGTAQFSDAGCSNVSVIHFSTPIDNRNDISFWVRDGLPSVATMVNKAAGKALDAGGANYSVYPHPSPNPANPYQRWKLQQVGSNYMMISIATNRALDAGGANDTEPYQHPTPNPANPHHLWKLQKVGSDYLVVSVATGRALDAGANSGNRVYMHPRPDASNPFQLWRLN